MGKGHRYCKGVTLKLIKPPTVVTTQLNQALANLQPTTVVMLEIPSQQPKISGAFHLLFGLPGLTIEATMTAVG